MKPHSLQMLIMLLCILPITLTSLAHSGGTDSYGGHHDRKRGGYHFHHGHGPHQHPFGICVLKNSSDSEPSNHSSPTLINTWHCNIGQYISFKYISLLIIGFGLGRFIKLKRSNYD